MVRENKPRLTLDRAAVYRIKVPGELNSGWAEWAGELTVTLASEGNGQRISILTITVDQAGLHSLLRRLYSLGLPLISVICVEVI